MAEELPNIIDVRRLVDGDREIRGTLGSRHLTRLPAPFRAVAPLSLALTFNADGQGRTRVTGHLSTALEAVCQRCLNDMPVTIARDIEVVLVDAEPEAAEADEPDDFVVIDDGRWSLAEFAQDELILACPMIPAHAQSDCPVRVGATSRVDEKRKPFADLASMLAASRRDSGE